MHRVRAELNRTNRLEGRYNPLRGIHLHSGGLGEKEEPLRGRKALRDPKFDEVDAGHLNMGDIYAFARHMSGWIPWLMIVLSVIVDGNLDPLHFDMSTAHDWELYPSARLTSGVLARFIQKEFCDWGVLEEITFFGATMVFCASKLFPVLKKSGMCRARFDSRNAGKVCDPPPPVNLAYTSTVVECLSETEWYWTADLKHWFYQIPIHERLRNFFAVKLGGRECGGRGWRMKVLPQGWSWSPYFAQCIAWSLILYHEANEAPMYDLKDLPPDGPPSQLPIRNARGEVIGWIFLWYDNILICCKDKEKVRRWAQRITKNVKDRDGMFSHPDPKSLSPEQKKLPFWPSIEPTREVCYVGIHAISTAVKRDRSGGSLVDSNVSFTVRWNHEADKYEKISKIRDLLHRPAELTPRVIQCAIGYIIWDSMIALRPLCHIREEIIVQRKFSHLIEKAKDWDRPLPPHCLEREELQCLEDALSRMASSENRMYQRVGTDVVSKRTVMIAVDASGVGHTGYGHGGAVLLQDTFGESQVLEIPLPDEAKRWDIDAKELYVLVEALKQLTEAGDNVLLGVDNTSALAWVRHKSCTEADKARCNDMLKELTALKLSSIRTFYLNTDDNVADSPSRREDITEGRWQRTKCLLSGSHLYAYLLTPALKGRERYTLLEVDALSAVELARTVRGSDRMRLSFAAADLGVEDYGSDVEYDSD